MNLHDELKLLEGRLSEARYRNVPYSPSLEDLTLLSRVAAQIVTIDNSLDE